MPPNLSAPDRAIYVASAALDKALSQLTDLRKGLAAIHLPIAAANDGLDHIDDMLAIVTSLIERRAAEPITAELERIQEAEEVEYAREHGLSALNARAA